MIVEIKSKEFQIQEYTLAIIAPLENCSHVHMFSMLMTECEEASNILVLL